MVDVAGPVDPSIAATGRRAAGHGSGLASYGDVLNVGAVALLPLVTPFAMRASCRDWPQAARAAAQLIVLAAAASGLVGAPG